MKTVIFFIQMLQNILILPFEINHLIICELSIRDVLTLRLVNSYFERLFVMWVQSNELKLRKDINNDVLRELTFLDYKHTSINLSYCKNITDNGLQYLTNCTIIDLWGCRNITDNGLKCLIRSLLLNCIVSSK